MDKKFWLIFAIVAIVISIVMLILVLVLPSQKKDSITSETKEHSTPKQENVKLWASFPGELKTTTFHNFGIYDYTDDMKNAAVKTQIKLEEKTEYIKFDFSDPSKIAFDLNNSYAISKDNLETKNEKFNGLSLGLYETLETLSNPKDFQIGINSIFYLFKKAFQSPDIFIRHLYSYNLGKSITPEDIRTKILKVIDKERQDKIIEGDSEYCLKKVLGFDHWIKLIGNDEEISKANWLKDLFGLNDEEIKSIFNKDEYLSTNWNDFNKKLSQEFKCKKDFCGNEIIYNQLINGNVVKFILGDKTSLVDLYSEINKDYYPFESSPELFNFFNIYKSKHREAKDYKDYTLTVEQLEKLIDESSNLSLLSSAKSLNFLVKLAENDIKSIASDYKINEKLPQFIYEYIYEYLPKLLIYRAFKEGKDTYNISPFIKLHSKLALDAIKETYYPARNIKISKIFDQIFNKLAFEAIEKLPVFKELDIDMDEFCYVVVQQALDDGRKALKICNDPITTFKSKEDITRWYAPYPCLMKNETKCDMTFVNHLKEIVYITDEEIKKLYEAYSFGKAMDDKYEYLKVSCGDKCHDDNYLMEIQFMECGWTKKLPDEYKKDYLKDLVPDLISEIFELPYFFEKKHITEKVTQESVKNFMKIVPSTKNSILNEENYLAFNNIYEFEKEFAKFLKGKGTDNYRLYALLNGIFVFDSPKAQYESIEDYLQGNNKEDKKYVEYLSKGDYYDNYNPGIKKITGLNFGINLDTGAPTSINQDNYTIDTNILRKIIDINNLQIMNIKKMEYDYIKKENTYVIEPIMNYEKLNGDNSYIDGFQYNHEDDTIYYLDRISSGIYKFNFKDDSDVKGDLTCRKYTLDESCLNDNSDSISQKLNKPLTISVNKDGLGVKIKDETKNENYICVEPNSNMVLESKINLIYSINTKNYGHLFYLLPKDTTNYPLFTYNREYKVDIDSFDEAFPGISSYKSFEKTLLIVGIIIMVLFCIFACFCIFMFCKLKRGKINLPSEGPDTKLLNSSKEEDSIHKSEE
jgi:hypothetical protein